MLREEFENLTGFYPTSEHYKAIEAAYLDYEGDKTAFCKAYKKNVNGMAEAIQRKVDMAKFFESTQAEKERKKIDEETAKKIERLEAQLEREQEWQPHEFKENVQQKDYDRLAKSGRVMSDEEAKDLIVRDWGFDRRRIVILHEVYTYKVNRHGACRRTGTIERLPRYESSDWNYIRFDVALMTYEMRDGDLRFYVQ